MYRRTKDITPYWLFVKDVAVYLRISSEKAHTIASLIWPASLIKPVYKDEAQLRKQRLKEQGPIIITTPYLLDEETCAELKQLA